MQMTKGELIKQAKEIAADQEIAIFSVDFLEKLLQKTETKLDRAFNKGDAEKIEELEDKFFTLLGKL